MVDQAKNIMIGIFVIAAVAIVIFILLFLHPSVGDEGRMIRVRFADIDKITVGTRVTFAGRPIGEVVSIQELTETRTSRKDHNGRVYMYELELLVDSGVNVYNTDQVASRTSGLLGEKSVAINPMPLMPGEDLRLVNNEILYATEVGSVEETLRELKELSNKFENTMDVIVQILEKIDEEKVVHYVGESVKNIAGITASLNQPEQWQTMLATIQKISAETYEAIPELKDTLQKINTSAGNLVSLSNSGKDLFVTIQSGEGSLGKILGKDELYLKLMALFNKAEVTMNDINHYGVLFHLDKGWQRLRARRMNLLARLSSPLEFSNYFNDEMDQVTTSLNRVEDVMFGLQNIDRNISLYHDDNFKKAFSTLLRRVAELEESLRMYNQQVADIETRKTEYVPDSYINH